MVVGGATSLVVACGALILIVCARKRKTKRPEQAVGCVCIQCMSNCVHSGVVSVWYARVLEDGDMRHGNELTCTSTS